MTDPSIVRAKRTFAYTDEHGTHMIRKGQTVRVGHPVLKGRDRLFEPATVDHEHKPKPSAATHKSTTRK